MELKLLKDFINLAKSEGVTELKYESKDVKLSVNFQSEAPLYTSKPSFREPVETRATQQVVSDAPKKEISNYHEIKSPFVGTFYGSSAPDKPAFVKVGDKVTKGQTLCILEAMKIMNEIEADTSGEIVEICCENESLVEYGQVLFKIK